MKVVQAWAKKGNQSSGGYHRWPSGYSLVVELYEHFGRIVDVLTANSVEFAVCGGHRRQPDGPRSGDT
jgi:hypothetical protein